MFCNQCGTAITNENTFCPKCGTKQNQPFQNSMMEQNGSSVLGGVSLAFEIFGFLLAIFVSSSVLAELFMFGGLLVGIFSLKDAYKTSGFKGFKSYFSFIYDGINNRNKANRLCCIAVFLGSLIIIFYLLAWFTIGLIEA